MSSTNNPNAILGGLPAGFDQQNPAYQLGFLKRRIPELQKEIAEEEGRLAAGQPELQQRAQSQHRHIKNLRDYAKKWAEGTHSGPWPQPPAGSGSGFLDMLGDNLEAVVVHGELDAKRKILMDMEARYDALQAVLPAAAKPTRQQQMADIQAEIADTHKQKAEMLASLQKIPNMEKTTLGAVARNFDDQIQTLVDKMNKL